MADLCKELCTGEFAANELLESMEILTELPIVDLHTNAELQGNLLRDYEHKFEQLLEDQKLSKLCSDVGLKIVEQGQFFVTFDEEGQDEMKNLCRKYTFLRSEEASRVRGWILGNTKIGMLLDVKVCFHQKRYSMEIMVESLFRDRTVYSVRIVNGIDKYVTETPETISLENVEHRVTGKFVASPISILVRERNWIDINPDRFRQDCFTVSKAMIRLLRHDPSVLREDDGSVRLDDIVKNQGNVRWYFAMVN